MHIKLNHIFEAICASEASRVPVPWPAVHPCKYRRRVFEQQILGCFEFQFLVEVNRLHLLPSFKFVPFRGRCVQAYGFIKDYLICPFSLIKLNLVISAVISSDEKLKV